MTKDTTAQKWLDDHFIFLKPDTMPEEKAKKLEQNLKDKIRDSLIGEK